MGGVGGLSAAHGVAASAFRATARGDGLFGGPNGELCGDVEPPCTIFQTTTDSGANWTRRIMDIASDYGGRPLIAADPSTEGHVAVGFLKNNSGEFHIYETHDSGETWSGPAIVTEDTSKAHFLSWMTYSPDGVLGLMWRTRHPDPNAPAPQVEGLFGPQAAPAPYNVWAAISRDGGATFSTLLQMSSGNSPAPGPLSSGDDYSGIDIDSEYIYVGWADWRPGERSGYFARASLEAFEDSAD